MFRFGAIRFALLGFLPVNAIAGTPITTPSEFYHAYVSFPSDCTPFYTVPVGKVLVITGLTFLVGNSGRYPGEVYLYSGTGSQCTNAEEAASSSNGNGPVTPYLGVGLAFAPGTTLLTKGDGALGTIEVAGYLVPSDNVVITTAGTSSSAASQGTR